MHWGWYIVFGVIICGPLVGLVLAIALIACFIVVALPVIVLILILCGVLIAIVGILLLISIGVAFVLSCCRGAIGKYVPFLTKKTSSDTVLTDVHVKKAEGKRQRNQKVIYGTTQTDASLSEFQTGGRLEDSEQDDWRGSKLANY